MNLFIYQLKVKNLQTELFQLYKPIWRLEYEFSFFPHDSIELAGRP